MIKENRLLETFCRLVSVDAPSLGERQMADALTELFEGLGASVEEDEAGELLGGNAGNLLIRWKGTLPGEPILLSLHMDTVAPALGKHPMVHEDGRITSNGDTVLGADDMSGMAAVLEAMASIQEEGIPHRETELLITVGEEIHLRGSGVFDYSRLRARESYVLDLSGPVGTAARKAPSLAVFTAVIRGKAAHAAFAPEEGIHAVQAASRAVSRLELGRVDERTTVNVGSIRGGATTNVVPELCTVTGEVRSLCHELVEKRLEEIGRCFQEEAAAAGAECSFQTELCFHAYETPEDHPVVQRFLQVCKSRKIRPVLTETFGGSDQHHLAAHGIPGVVLASAMHRVHSCEEYTTVSEMVQVAEIVEGLLTDIGNGSQF